MKQLHTELRRVAQAGFTLIELMVVLVIIGVLAALIVPNVLDRADDARVTAARTDVNNLMQALKLYRLDNQRYPTAEQARDRRRVHRSRAAERLRHRRTAARRGPELQGPIGGAGGRQQPQRESRATHVPAGRAPGQHAGIIIEAMHSTPTFPGRPAQRARRLAQAGFTLIELMVVLELPPPPSLPGR